MSDFEYFLAAVGFITFVLLYIAAVGHDPEPRHEESALDL
jgi:hypothetical protein